MKSKWSVCKLQEIISFKNGKKKPSEKGNIPVYGGNGILGYVNRFNLKKGIAIGRVGAYCGSVYYSDKECWISDNAIQAINNTNSDMRFDYYLLNYLRLNERRIGTGQPLLTQEILNRIEIKCPPLQTQKKIAAILSALDDKIALNTAINENLEQQAQAIFKSWFVDFEPFGSKMPAEWKVGKLSEILKLKKHSIQPNTDESLPYLPIDLIPIKSLAIKEVRPNKEALSSLLRFDENDILIGAMRVYFHRVAIAPFNGITRTTCFILEPFNPKYLAYGLITCNQDLTIDYAQKTSKGSTMPYAIWEGGLGDFEIPIPDEKTADKFNKIMKPLFEQIKKSFFENKYLQEIRDSLLPKLMNGKIDVSEVKI